jgi:hypothetical protein
MVFSGRLGLSVCNQEWKRLGLGEEGAARGASGLGACGRYCGAPIGNEQHDKEDRKLDAVINKLL